MAAKFVFKWTIKEYRPVHKSDIPHSNYIDEVFNNCVYVSV